MGTLFECLKEARLEKYYPSFRAQGITKSEALTRLTVQDCTSFGINSAEDKRRLLELINIVKSVHNVEKGNYLTGASNRAVQHVKNKSPRKRNRSPAQLPHQVVIILISKWSNVIHFYSSTMFLSLCLTLINLFRAHFNKQADVVLII